LRETDIPNIFTMDVNRFGMTLRKLDICVDQIEDAVGRLNSFVMHVLFTYWFIVLGSLSFSVKTKSLDIFLEDRNTFYHCFTNPLSKRFLI